MRKTLLADVQAAQELTLQACLSDHDLLGAVRGRLRAHVIAIRLDDPTCWVVEDMSQLLEQLCRLTGQALEQELVEALLKGMEPWQLAAALPEDWSLVQMESITENFGEGGEESEPEFEYAVVNKKMMESPVTLALIKILEWVAEQTGMPVPLVKVLTMAISDDGLAGDVTFVESTPPTAVVIITEPVEGCTCGNAGTCAACRPRLMELAAQCGCGVCQVCCLAVKLSHPDDTAGRVPSL